MSSVRPAPGEIHVWQVTLDDARREPVALTDAERRVADGYDSPRARSRHVAGRTFLRRRLGRMLGCAPLAVDIVDGLDGKPALADPVLSFNVSHAGEWLLVAISLPRRLGVDVEEIRPGRDVRAIIEELLDIADRDAVTREPSDEAFFRYWTRYEAVVKARGDGLVVPLRALADVAADLDVQDLDVAAGYVAAVAADRGPWRVVRCP